LLPLIGAAVRITFALLGVYWGASGLIGLTLTLFDDAWGAAASEAVTTLLGAGMAYAAIVRAPWERKATPLT
jgi:hypothetical protein